MLRILERFLRCERGSSIVEFAIVVPILALLTMSATDLGMYILLHQKLESAANSAADLAARDDTLNVSQLNDIYSSMAHIMKPFDVGANGVAIVSGVGATVDNTPEVYWQLAGAGTLSATSQIGVVGEPATMPAVLTVLAGQTVIVAEVYYQFEPLFGSILSPITMRRTIYVRPRLGSLDTLDP